MEYTTHLILLLITHYTVNYNALYAAVFKCTFCRFIV